MANQIKMPQLSDTMHEGKILSWHKKEGDSVNRGDILAEVETDKANLEIECFHSGTLLKISAPAGTMAKVGEVIAIVGEDGEKIDSSNKNMAEEQTQETIAKPPAPQSSSPQLQVVSSQSKTQPAAVVERSDRIKASPLARKIAEQRNIELSGVKGSGPNGRIIRKDLESTKTQTAEVNPQYSTSSPVSAGNSTLTPFSKMREVIARRMQETVRESPHFYVTTSIEMSEAKKLREILKERQEFKGISINHLVIKACAYAIEREARVNNAVKDDQLYQPSQINIGIITAVDDGLLIPVIKEANTLSLKDLVFEARSAVERARAGRPNSTDLSGGTFSISNMGMYDIESFTALINPGQGAVLAVSSIKEEPIVRNGQIIIGNLMKATISVDHRIIDGVMAGSFLKFFKEALETPALLMI